ncbi:MAG: hypothetical protein HRT81_12950 [Henriciella sp.]|nr:hypothetical protein [Henriciella sp.]
MSDTLERTQSVEEIMMDIGARANAAKPALAIASAERKHAALIGMAEAIEANVSAILNANAIDLEKGVANNMSSAMLDRLKLDDDRVRAMANGILHDRSSRLIGGDLVFLHSRTRASPNHGRR